MIRFNSSIHTPKTLEYINDAFNKNHISGDGEYSKLCHEWFIEKLNCHHALLTHSCTGALEIAAILADLKIGDEVIMPSYTFCSTANAFALRGVVPVFIDIREDTLNMDEKLISDAITPRTKAIVPVHYAGIACEMDEIMNIAKKHSLKVIEDSADTIGYSVNGKNFGKFSDISTTSFYASHIVTGAGFGGMVCFNDKKLYEEAKILRGWGRSSATFNESEDIKQRFSAKVSGMQYDGKYIFLRMGYNFLPSEISAAFGLEQLKKLKKNIGISNQHMVTTKTNNKINYS
jgi:dTDP-4-amino-4,6-dideoxygalactose transaminase